MKKKKGDNFIHIEFTGKQISYDIQTKSHNEIIAAIMGLESYACNFLTLDIVSVREIIDEMKSDFQVKEPKS